MTHLCTGPPDIDVDVMVQFSINLHTYLVQLCCGPCGACCGFQPADALHLARLFLRPESSRLDLWLTAPLLRST